VAEILVLVLVATLLFVVFGAVVLVRRRGEPRPPDRRRDLG
jgi:hypothetical protein